ncbi:MAG: GDSL-type esterase/lipase family protein [Planctomycetota bacterium]
MHRSLLALFFICSLVPAVETPVPVAVAPVWQFEKQVADYEAKDKANPPAIGTIVFIGSSTFTRWSSVVTDMAPLPVYNHAFGGSRTADVLQAVPRLIVPNKPKVIVYYCGDNDMAKESADPAVPVQGFKDFVAKVRADLPTVRIIYVSIKPSPSRIAVWPKAQIANAQVQTYCASDPTLTYVEIGKQLLDSDGKPKETLYVKDRLHLNEEGYKLITVVLKPEVEKVWKSAQTE